MSGSYYPNAILTEGDSLLGFQGTGGTAGQGIFQFNVLDILETLRGPTGATGPILNLPDQTGHNTHALVSNGTTYDWFAIANSVFGRTGNVVAQTGDYTATQVTGAVGQTRSVLAGTGLSGGGDLSADRTFSITATGTPGTYTKVTTNAQGQVTSGTTLVLGDLPAGVALTGSANTFTTGSQTLQSGAAGNRGLIVQGTTSQTANLQEWQEVGGGVLASVNSVGSFVSTGTVTGSNLSGTNTGDVTLSGQNYLSISNQVITVGQVDLSGTHVTGVLAAGRFPALIGDITTTAGSLTTVLTTVNGNVGTFNTVTVNAKGLVTAASNAAYITASSVDILTNKTFDAQGTGNVLSNITTTHFASGVVDNDAALATNSSTRLPTQQAVKSYVDNSLTGLQWKQSVRAATTAVGTLASSFENGDTVDGVSLATGDRILIKNQVDGTENGFYVVAVSGAPTRTLDADSNSELPSATVLVREGTVNGDTQWTCTNNTVTLGSTSIVFAQIAGAGVYTAGTGLSLTGNQFSIDSTVVTLTGTQTLTNKSIVATQLTGTLQAGQFPALTGDVTTSAGALATTIANDAVTYAKMQNISATSRIIGRKTAGAGDPEEMTLSETLDLIGSVAQGDILYRSGAGWARLPAGTNGHILQTQGAGANPQWVANPSAPVSSVFTRTGDVVATTGDYTAAQVTNAVDSTATYSNPAWITALAGSKITGNISGQAGSVANGVYTNVANTIAVGNQRIEIATVGHVGLTVKGASSQTGNLLNLTDNTDTVLFSVTSAGNVAATNLSGTNTGDVTLSGENYLSRSNQVITANAVNLSGTHVIGTLAAGRFPALSGDVTTTAGSLATTLATVNGNVGTFNTVTVNAKGLVTAASNTAYITASSTNILTNKTFDAQGTGNSLSNVSTTNFAANVVDNDSTLAASSSTRLPTQQAVKVYVDNLVTGLAWKQAVRAATTIAGTLATAFEDGDTVDGVVLATGDRILLKNQSDVTENGIYTVNTSGAPTRSSDANTGAEIISATVFVREGTANGDTQWTCSNDSVTIGSTSITFAQVSGAGTYTAGTGLSLTGNQFSIDSTVVTLTGTQTLTNKSIVATQLTGTLQATQFPALTGDVTTSAGSLGTTLATVNSNVGVFNTLTVNAKGLVTAASNTAYITASSTDTLTNKSIVATQLTGTLQEAQFPALTGDVTTSAGALATTLSNTGVSASTYKSLTVDVKGRVTAGTNPTTLAGYGITDAMPLLSTVTGVSAAGSAQGDATVLSGSYSVQEVTTVGSGQGVRLPTVTATSEVTIISRGANALLVYPASGEAIDGGSADVAVTMPINGVVTFQGKSGAWYTNRGMTFNSVSPTALGSTSPGSSLDAARSDHIHPAADLSGSQVTGTLAAGRFPALSGDVSTSAGSLTTTIPNNTVTYAKMQDISATSRVLGRKTAAAGDTEEVTLSELLDFIGSAAQGDILYRGAATWARLAAGTSGQFLKTLGAGASLAWDTVAVGGADVQLFPASGTWTKPANKTQSLVLLIGGGGGGGSGRKGAASSNRRGGGGGAAGGITGMLFATADLGSTETVTIGAGGGGGAPQSTNSTNGNNGSVGGETTFGSKLQAGGGGAGTGGDAATNAGGATGVVASGSFLLPFPAAATVTGPAGGNGRSDGNGNAGNGVFGYSGGGAGGGGVSSGNTAFTGGLGGELTVAGTTSTRYPCLVVTGGAIGAVDGNGGNGNSVAGITFNSLGSGGGGGGGSTTTNGGNGGNGGNYGSGGGGGGGSTDSVGNSGAGGAGTGGYCLVISW